MLEDYFSLQLTVASHYATEARVPFELAVARCTNLRRRLHLWGPPGAARWDAFLSQMRKQAIDRAALLSTCSAFHRCRPQAAPTRLFGCFSYDSPDAAGVLRVHFMPPENISASPLAAASLHARAGELRAMFAHIRRTERNAESVMGVSWLYNLDAYKRLFPSAYVAAIRPPWFPLHLNGSSTWGQVLDWRQGVKPAMRDGLLGRLHLMKAEAPWEVFPLQALAANCNVRAFYELLG